jgi:hypothetical protein
MDDLTHLAIAGTLGYALRARGMTMRDVGVMAVAAVAPDIEGVIGWFSAPVYLTYYHGPAHSLIGALLLGALVAFIAKRYFKVPSPWLAAGLGIVTHLLLDGVTGFGEKIFWPFIDRRLGTPLIANYDLCTLAILALCLIIPAILNAVNREIKARLVNASLMAAVALGLIVALVPLRAVWRSRAYDRAHAQPLVEDPDSMSVFPSAIMPWVFNVIEDTPIAYMVYEMDGYSGTRRTFVTRFAKPQKNNLLEAARDSPTGKIFLEMASVPFYSLEDGRRAPMIRIRDLGFYAPGGSNKPFSVEIEVKSTKEVVAERANF